MDNMSGIYKNKILIIQNGNGLYGHRHVVKYSLNIQNGTVHTPLVRVGTNKLVGRLAETRTRQSVTLYRGEWLDSIPLVIFFPGKMFITLSWYINIYLFLDVSLLPSDDSFFLTYNLNVFLKRGITLVQE